MRRMPERRNEERRGDERRLFRQQRGRRGERPLRRGSRRRRRRLLVLLTLLALASFALRVSVVAPRRAAAAQAAEGRDRVADLLRRLNPPTLALLGAGAPASLPPPVGPLVTDPADVAMLEELEADLAGPLRRFPGELILAEVLGPTRLLLGRDGDARTAWETLLAQGDGDQRAEARLGLGVVALRAGLREAAPQDRAFAFDHALWRLDAVPADADGWPAARFDRAVALIELGRLDAARQLILTIATDDPAGAAVLGTHLIRREPPPVVLDRPPP
jgi:hypothetical protein